MKKLIIFLGLVSSPLIHASQEVIYIPMLGSRDITLSSDENIKKTIYTDNLLGCLAVALIIKTNNKQYAHLSHFSNLSYENQLQNLKKSNTSFHNQIKNTPCEKKLILFVPGSYQKIDDKWQLIVLQDYAQHLIEFPKLTQVPSTVILYDTNKFQTDTDFITGKNRVFKITLSNTEPSTYSCFTEWYKNTPIFEHKPDLSDTSIVD